MIIYKTGTENMDLITYNEISTMIMKYLVCASSKARTTTLSCY
jgi:hypothetical protein